MMPATAQRLAAPRTVGIEFPFGHPFGMPEDHRTQRLVLDTAVRVLACASVLGVMLVALIANHLKNGFFIFRPGEGYEYVLMVACVSIALGALGGGRVSLDNAIGFDVDGWGGLALTALAGGGGAAAVLL